MKRKIVVSAVLISSILALSAGFAAILIRTRPAAETVNTTRPPMLVRTIEMRPQTVVEPLIGFGAARADRYARLSAQVTGQIVDVPNLLKPGVRVTT